jgi:hypothetical protein
LEAKTNESHHTVEESGIERILGMNPSYIIVHLDKQFKKGNKHGRRVTYVYRSAYRCDSATARSKKTSFVSQSLAMPSHNLALEESLDSVQREEKHLVLGLAVRFAMDKERDERTARSRLGK